MNQRNSGASTVIIVVASVLGGIVVLGILAAIAIPQFLEYKKKAKRSEAELNLDAASKGVKAYWLETGMLPPTNGGPTPATSCCEQMNHKCAVDLAQWDVEPWSSIFFMVDEPHYYQYSYAVDGDRFTLTATGDLDCDGTTVDYVLHGSVAGGNLTQQLEKPARAD